MDLHNRKAVRVMSEWFWGIWTAVTSFVSLPLLLVKLRQIWYGATEITVTKCKQTYELIASYFPRKS